MKQLKLFQLASYPDELLEMQTTTPGLNMQQFLHVIVQFAPGNQGRFGCEKEVSVLACSISNRVEYSSTLRELHVPILYLVDRRTALWAAFAGNDPDSVTTLKTRWAATSRDLNRLAHAQETSTSRISAVKHLPAWL
jgi:hypothetical protein